MSFEVTVLGSGTVIASAGRRATSLLVDADGKKLLFDCGPSIPNALVEKGLSLYSLESIFITHLHPDHTLGLGHLIASAVNDSSFPEEGSIDIFGPNGIEDFIEKWYNLYPSLEKSRRFLRVNKVSVSDEIRRSGVKVDVGRAFHGEIEAHAFRARYAGSTFCFTGDTAYSDRLADFARGSDLLAAECSFPNGGRTEGHMTPSWAGRLASRSGAGKLLLVHMYPAVDGAEAERAAGAEFDGVVIAARDGMTVAIPGDQVSYIPD